MLPRCLLCLVSLCPRCAAAVPTLPCGGTPVLHRLLRTRSTPTWLTAWGAACCGSCGRQALAAVLRASPSLLPHASAFAALSSAFVLQFPEKNNQLPLYASPVQRFCNTPSIPWAACRHFPASGPLLRPPTPAHPPPLLLLARLPAFQSPALCHSVAAPVAHCPVSCPNTAPVCAPCQERPQAFPRRLPACVKQNCEGHLGQEDAYAVAMLRTPFRRQRQRQRFPQGTALFGWCGQLRVLYMRGQKPAKERHAMLQ